MGDFREVFEECFLGESGEALAECLRECVGFLRSAWGRGECDECLGDSLTSVCVVSCRGSEAYRGDDPSCGITSIRWVSEEFPGECGTIVSARV